MQTHYKLSLALAALTAALTGQAQPAVASSTGLLGQRYAEASVGAVDPHHSSDYGFSGNLGVNLPVQSGIDLGFSYGYDRIKTDIGSTPLKLRSRDHTLASTLTFYSNAAGMKPFAGVGLGYQWNRTKLDFGGARVSDTRDSDGIWALGAGVEIPVAGCTVTPSVSYQDGFSSDSAAGFVYGVQAHTWFTRTLGGFAEVAFSDPTGGGTQSWIYRLGARVRF